MLSEVDSASAPVYEVVEAKYVDGVKAFDKDGNPIYRVPTGVYGNTYFAVNGDIIEFWVADEAGNKVLLETFENWTGTLESAIDAYISGSLNLQTVVEEDQYALLP